MLTWNNKSNLGEVQTMTEKAWKQNRKKRWVEGKEEETHPLAITLVACNVWISFYMDATEYLFSIFNDLVPPGTYMVHVGKEHIVSSTHLRPEWRIKLSAKIFSHYFKISAREISESWVPLGKLRRYWEEATCTDKSTTLSPRTGQENGCACQFRQRTCRGDHQDLTVRKAETL